MPTAVIVDAVRTPLGRRNGKLAGTHPVDLAAHTLRALVERLRPRHHFCGHMHRPLDARIGLTAVSCLSLLRDSRNALALLERGPDGTLHVSRPGS